MIKTRILPAGVLSAIVAVALAMPGAAMAAGGEAHIEDISFSFEMCHIVTNRGRAYTQIIVTKNSIRCHGLCCGYVFPNYDTK